MPTSPLKMVIQQLRTASERAGAGRTDGELLTRFLSHRDNDALAALVHRHAPMVWGVCRRLLRSPHDAEDALQATFLVLVRKAATVKPREMVGNWLYGVAHHTAVRLRATAAKRGVREMQMMETPEPVVAKARGDDLLLLLDHELSCLPEKYRVMIVLCDLESKTRIEVARQLAIPEGTVASRLARARGMLAKRLARHGLAVSGGSLAAALSQTVASASVPTSVASSTIKVVTLVAAGKTATIGLVSAKVVALTEGVLKAMLLNKLKTMMTVLFVVLGMVAFGGGLYIHQAGAQQDPADKSPAVGEKGEKKGETPANAPPRNFTNSFGMKFVWIPPGNFMMGSPKEEKERVINEAQHKVTLSKGFYMGVYPVTQEQWQAVMGNNPSQFKGEKSLPVEQVSWEDCQEFIKKLRDKDKKPYRLPTESEWEYACRAGTTTPFHFGETISTDQANYNGDSTYGNGKKGAYRKKTTTVGSFPANAWGLHDMHGNVWQWCQDWHAGDYPEKDVIDPPGPENPPDKLRVLRGGSFYDDAKYCRSAYRHWNVPGHRIFHYGCRLCFFVETPQTKDKE
jgi:RNA polymerase sigma factor (sigma-70 family)